MARYSAVFVFVLFALVNFSECMRRERRYVPGMRREEALRRANQLLDNHLLIDGHNDLPWQYRNRINNKVNAVNLTEDMNAQWGPCHTDIPRLRQGEMGAQFWSAYMSCSSNDKDAVRAILEQIDVIHRFVSKYPDHFEFATSVQEIEDAFAAGKIASLIGVEGGHSMDSSLAALRMLYDLGTRYMTLTHSCSLPWVANSKEDNEAVPPTVGLSDWGYKVIAEMNRLGMIIDISHVAKATMNDTLASSVAPVIFSHSNPWSLCNHDRNVQDDILYKLANNSGVIMITFVNSFLTCFPSNGSIYDVALVADYIEYVRDLIGVDYVGIGGDFDGMPSVPVGLEDVSKYPNLFAELIQRGWSDQDVKKVAGENVLRVFRGVEQVRDDMAQQGVQPYDDPIPEQDLDPDHPCRT